MKKTLSVVVALLIFALSAMPVFAVPSPTAAKEYKVTVHNNNGGSGSYTAKIDKDGKHATIKAHPKNGYEFVKWTAKGKYDIEDGDLNSDTLRILLGSDVEFTPIFKKIGGKTTPTEAPVSRNDSPVSPKTGDNSLYFIIGWMVLLVAACSAVGIKLAVSKK